MALRTGYQALNLDMLPTLVLSNSAWCKGLPHEWLHRRDSVWHLHEANTMCLCDLPFQKLLRIKNLWAGLIWACPKALGVEFPSSWVSPR